MQPGFGGKVRCGGGVYLKYRSLSSKKALVLECILVWASQPRRPMTEAKFRDNFSVFQLISVDFS